VGADAVDLAPSLAAADHVSCDGGAVEKAEQSRGAAMGDDCAVAAGQRRRPHSSPLPDRRVADRIDAAEDPMQVPGPNEVLESAPADAEPADLAPGDHSVLVCCQPRQL
jgi:hypothetical protein